MVDEKLRKRLSENGYEDSIVFDNPSFDNSIVGLTENGETVYDYDRMLAEYCRDNKCEIEDAIDWIDYNTIRTIPYITGIRPIIATLDENEELIDIVHDGKKVKLFVEF